MILLCINRIEQVTYESGKKDSMETVVCGKTENLKEDQTIHKKNTNAKYPIYELNKLLLLKISNLAHQNTRMRQIIASVRQSHQIEKMNLNVRKLGKYEQISTQYYEYFKHNYKRKGKDFKQWLQHHANLILWKLNGYKTLYEFTKKESLIWRLPSLQNVINELEYRYYIEYVLEERTMIQKICSYDMGYSHMVLLAIQVFQESSKRVIIELSDGWYSLFLIGDNELYRKITPGDKIHLTNISDYPLEINHKNVSLNTYYQRLKQQSNTNIQQGSLHLPLILSRGHLRRRNQESSSYHISYDHWLVQGSVLKKLVFRQIGGKIPCIDVFVVQKSYLYKEQGMSKKIVDSEEDSRDLQFSLRVIDSLNFFDNSQVCESYLVGVANASQIIYQQIQIGGRIRIMNSQPLKDQLYVRISNKSGIYSELQQYPQFIKMVNIESSYFDLKVRVVKYFDGKYQNFVIGVSSDKVYKIEIWKSFFGSLVDKERILNVEVQFTQLKLDLSLGNKKFPNDIPCRTTLMTRILLL